MTPFLALLPRDDDWTNYIWFVILVVVPLIARFFKWLVGTVRGTSAPAQQEDPREQLRRAREERRQSESEGEDLWRKLARGEELTVPMPAPSEPAQASGTRWEVPAERSLESEEEPAALSVMGDVAEPSEASEVSLEREEEPVPLAALAAGAVLAPTAFEATPEAAKRLGFQLGRGDLRRAILLSEVLGPPVSERPQRA